MPCRMETDKTVLRVSYCSLVNAQNVNRILWDAEHQSLSPFPFETYHVSARPHDKVPKTRRWPLANAEVANVARKAGCGLAQRNLNFSCIISNFQALALRLISVKGPFRSTHGSLDVRFRLEPFRRVILTTGIGSCKYLY